jgi:hypothetical protein
MDHLKACTFLPKVQVQAIKFTVHISYFLQKYNKGKPYEYVRSQDLAMFDTYCTTLDITGG